MPSSYEVLLINPWIYDFTAYDFWAKPLGLLQVAAFLNKRGSFRLSFVDCLDRFHPQLPKPPLCKPDGRGAYAKQEVPKPEALKGIPRKYSRYGIPIPLFLSELDQVPQPDIVMITCTMTYWYPGVQTVIDLIRKRFGAVPVVLGGIYASLLPDHARRESGADFVYVGRAEDKLGSLLNEILGTQALASNYPAKVFLWPDYSLLRDRSSLPVMTSTGCPWACSFCASPILYPLFRQHLPSSVVSLIERLVRCYRTKNIAFYDDALLCGKKRHIIPILEGILEKNLHLSFHTPNGLHVREIDPELALLMKKTNFTSIFLSQETFTQNVIEESCPKVGQRDLENALSHLEKAGYSRNEINVYLIVGLPDQDAAGIQDSILQVQHLGARPRLAFYSPVPLTPDWQKAVERGFMKEGADPLLHNKLTFPYLWGRISPDEFRSLCTQLN